ncbi:LysR family transcriptional regulator [Pseudomonas aeruginosa]|nr:LysR family transcriptional regulator [Pseudomonas aeruginosa]
MPQLLTEHNVTRAAERLNFSQLSVSVHLAKLRAIFDDPLLLPGPRGMRPTARAEELREPLRLALEALEQTVAPAAPFDPAQSRHTWRVAATDYAESAVLLPLLAALRGQAPDLRCRRLFSERYVLAGRAGHPGLRRRPTLKQFCRLDQVIVSPDGGGFLGPTDQALAELGAERRVALSVPHFLFLRAVLESTDLVAMLPSRLARGRDTLRVVEAPLEVPGYDLAMLWHERSHRDPAHRWLRELVAASV